MEGGVEEPSGPGLLLHSTLLQFVLFFVFGCFGWSRCARRTEVCESMCGVTRAECFVGLLLFSTFYSGDVGGVVSLTSQKLLITEPP